MHHWDTSALAKLYVAEPDSAQFSEHWSQTRIIAISGLARWELFCVLAKKEASGLIPTGAAEILYAEFLTDIDSGSIVVIPMSENVEELFRKLVLQLHSEKPPLLVRTLDGIHTATASLHDATEFISTDTNMRKCATAIGLKVFP